MLDNTNSYKMSRVKGKETQIENVLGKILSAHGLKGYRRNKKGVPGTPDFCWKNKKIAIFCDSEFWHGKNWKVRKYDHKSNRKFWWSKIEQNIERDRAVNKKLRKSGWVVLRFWGKDILKDPNKCVKKVKFYLSRKK